MVDVRPTPGVVRGVQPVGVLRGKRLAIAVCEGELPDHKLALLFIRVVRVQPRLQVVHPRRHDLLEQRPPQSDGVQPVAEFRQLGNVRLNAPGGELRLEAVSNPCVPSLVDPRVEVGVEFAREGEGCVGQDVQIRRAPLLVLGIDLRLPEMVLDYKILEVQILGLLLGGGLGRQLRVVHDVRRRREWVDGGPLAFIRLLVVRALAAAALAVSEGREDAGLRLRLFEDVLSLVLGAAHIVFARSLFALIRVGATPIVVFVVAAAVSQCERREADRLRLDRVVCILHLLPVAIGIRLLLDPSFLVRGRLHFEGVDEQPRLLVGRRVDPVSPRVEVVDERVAGGKLAIAALAEVDDEFLVFLLGGRILVL